MNKRYIDFVPVSKTKNTPKVVKNISSVKVAKSQKVGGARVVRKTIMEKETKVVMKTASVSGSGSPAMIQAKKVQATKSVSSENSAIEGGLSVKSKNEAKIPQVNFINQEKVVKRPLSKNIYMKEIEEIEEKSKAPEVIISEEGKKSKMGVFVAVIVAILLGIAAGTAVFFILPK